MEPPDHFRLHPEIYLLEPPNHLFKFFLESKMKLSSRKELLNESELTLKSIKKSLNESPKNINRLFKNLTTSLDREQDNMDKEFIDFRKQLIDKYSNNLNQKYSNSLQKFIGNNIDSFYKGRIDQDLVGTPISSAKLEVDYESGYNTGSVIYIKFGFKNKTKTFSIDVRELSI